MGFARPLRRWICEIPALGYSSHDVEHAILTVAYSADLRLSRHLEV